MKLLKKILSVVKKFFITETIIPETDPDVDTMARTIWGEARSEGILGMQAVACVIINRFHENIWYSKYKGEHSIKAVCLKPKQFSCWNDDDPNKKVCELVDKRNKQFVQALEISKDAKMGKLKDITNGANHYYADYIKTPKWVKDMKFCVKIGRHNFYKG